MPRSDVITELADQARRTGRLGIDTEFMGEGRYRSLVDGLLQQDNYLLLADFAAYVAAQSQVDALYADPVAWAARCTLNIAAMGSFSADRTVAEYRDTIWAPPAGR